MQHLSVRETFTHSCPTRPTNFSYCSRSLRPSLCRFMMVAPSVSAATRRLERGTVPRPSLPLGLGSLGSTYQSNSQNASLYCASQRLAVTASYCLSLCLPSSNGHTVLTECRRAQVHAALVCLCTYGTVPTPNALVPLYTNHLSHNTEHTAALSALPL